MLEHLIVKTIKEQARLSGDVTSSFAQATAEAYGD
jgi:hypothetical protein